MITLARRVATVPGESEHDQLAHIQDADELVRVAGEQLTLAVDGARERGVSWQAIGSTLGTSRQAAFKRFAAAKSGDDLGNPSGARPVDLSARTAEVFAALDAGDYEAVAALMTYTCARLLSKRKLLGVWREVVTTSGRLDGCYDTIVQTPDGTSGLGRLTNQFFSNGAIVQTTLRHEAGEWTGRVAYSGTGKITGLLIAPVGATNLPF